MRDLQDSSGPGERAWSIYSGQGLCRSVWGGGCSSLGGGLQGQAMQISVRDNAIYPTRGWITSPLEISCSPASLMILYSGAPRVIFPSARDIHLSVQSRGIISARLLDLGCARVNKKNGVCRQHAALPSQR